MGGEGNREPGRERKRAGRAGMGRKGEKDGEDFGGGARERGKKGGREGGREGGQRSTGVREHGSEGREGGREGGRETQARPHVGAS